MSGLVVVCQESARASQNRGKAHNAVANMRGNARVRKCYLADEQTEDSHPQSVELHATWKVKNIKITRQ